MDNAYLLAAMRYQLKKDTTIERQKLISQWLEDNFLIKFIIEFLENPLLIHLKTIAVILVSLSRAGSVYKFNDKNSYLIFWSPAEEKTLRHLKNSIPQDKTHLISWSTNSYKILHVFVFIYEAILDKKIKKSYSIAYRVCKTHSLLISVRALESLFSTIYFMKTLHTLKTIFYISTESNPHGTALIHLAKRQKTKVVFIAHSPLIDNPLPVFFNVALFWGQAMHKQFIKNGSTIHLPLFASTPFSPLSEPSEKQILLALSKNVDTEALKNLIIALQNHSVFGKYKIVLRPHPNKSRPVDKMFQHFIVAHDSVETALQKASLVIAGHSTFHLEALSRLKPSFFCAELDGSSTITLPFLLSGEVLTWDTLQNAAESTETNAYSLEEYNRIRNYYFHPGDTSSAYLELKDWVNTALK